MSPRVCLRLCFAAAAHAGRPGPETGAAEEAAAEDLADAEAQSGISGCGAWLFVRWRVSLAG
eukprot:365126-Chlamydomonas_euryale.AAC.49